MNTELKKRLVKIAFAFLSVCMSICLYMAYYCVAWALYKLIFKQTSSILLSSILAFIATAVVFISFYSALVLLHKFCAFFTESVIDGYESFRNESVADNIFSEVFNDPTIRMQDKILFVFIYSIYLIQIPFLYCSSKVLNFLSRKFPTQGDSFIEKVPQGLYNIVNFVFVIPALLLELIKYPLIKLFTPLGLNIKRLSFLFNVRDVRDVDDGSQTVHTSSFENSVFQCAKELKEKYGVPSDTLDKEFEEYINNSDELEIEQKGRLKSYLNFNQSHTATWRESRTGLTLTQAANLVLAAAKSQKLNVDLIKCMLLMRLQEGNGACYLGMFNRIIYALSCLEAKNNFTVEVNSQIYEKMPEITERFFKERCNYRKLKTLKDNFNDFYSENNIDPNIKNDIGKLIEDARQYVFNKLYVDYFNSYG